MFRTRHLTKINVILILFYLGYNSAEPQFQACGRELMRTMAYICNHHYNGPNYRRILDVDKYGDEYMKPSYFLNDFLMDYQITDTYDSEEQHDRLNRQKPGIVNECCKNSCTPSVLRSYCGKNRQK